MLKSLTTSNIKIIRIPIITIIFLNRYIVIRPFYQRMVFTLFFIFLLTGIEKAADFLGVLKHSHWKLWWSIRVWLAILSVPPSWLTAGIIGAVTGTDRFLFNYQLGFTKQS